MAEKKKWERPQLIILARGTPDESVLTHCKYIGYMGAPPGVGATPYSVGQAGCDWEETDGNCGACQSRSGT